MRNFVLVPDEVEEQLLGGHVVRGGGGVVGRLRDLAVAALGCGRDDRTGRESLGQGQNFPHVSHFFHGISGEADGPGADRRGPDTGPCSTRRKPTSAEASTATSSHAAERSGRHRHAGCWDADADRRHDHVLLHLESRGRMDGRPEQRRMDKKCELEHAFQSEGLILIGLRSDKRRGAGLLALPFLGIAFFFSNAEIGF